MNKIFACFPEFKTKALTLSYDDAVRQDKRLIGIMKKHGLKGTFNINSGLFSKSYNGVEQGQMTLEEAKELYDQEGAEVAIHGYKHVSLAKVNSSQAIYEVMQDRKELETFFGKIITGMAYANGSYDNSTLEVLKSCGISYARTVNSTESFELPQDWLVLNPTCHHNNPKLMDLAEKFLNYQEPEYFWDRSLQLFYLWGHSWEFDKNNNWDIIENFAEIVGNRKDVWYATNGEIFEYLKACGSLVFSADSRLVYNPSAISVYIDFMGKKTIIAPRETVKIDY